MMKSTPGANNITRNLAGRELTQSLPDFCQRWKIRELSLFGSVVRSDFRSDSDVDVMVSFLPAAGWDLYDIVEMRKELEEIFGRDVDFVEREAIVNPYRKEAIFKSAEVLYAA